jgi:ADP-heptose:LPS heptosyltransferase
VTSLIGKSPLGQLPVLMRGASLFLGNDSGLKHIAAGLGIPTVGVHGGTLDVREWGPVGPNALAVVRDVVCSPCYLSKVEDCRRDVACLRQLEPARVYEACRRLLPTDAPAQPASLPGDTKPGAARRPLAAKRRAETGAQEGRA